MTPLQLLIPYVVLLALPVFAGVVLIVASRQRGRGYPACGACAYDLTGSIGLTARCPECGRAFAEVGIMPPRRRRNRFLLCSGIVSAALPLAYLGWHVVQYFQIQSAMNAAAANARAKAAAKAAVRIPPPLTQEEVNEMIREQAGEAWAQVATALVDADLDEETKARLRSDFEMLRERMRQTNPASQAR